MFVGISSWAGVCPEELEETETGRLLSAVPPRRPSGSPLMQLVYDNPSVSAGATPPQNVSR